MQKIIINLEHCYGIKKLNSEIDFSAGRSIALYASNGILKTSFAKTFKDISNGAEPHDLVFPNRKSLFDIRDESNSPIKKENIFVIESYREDLNPERVSTLLVNPKLRQDYEKVNRNLDTSTKSFLTAIKSLSGIKGDLENIADEIRSVFSKGNFFEVLESIENDVLKAEIEFSSIVYDEIFNEKVQSFLNDITLSKDIEEYVDQYNKLLSKSKYLRNGFDPQNALAVQKSLDESHFFDAKHSINLYDGKSDLGILDVKSFKKIIDEEKKTIFEDTELQRRWDKIDKKINYNKELRQFSENIRKSPAILNNLKDPDKLRKNIFVSYFAKNNELFNAVLTEYKSAKIEIGRIAIEAKQEAPEWKRVIDKFKRRFFVPFELRIDNQDDVILNGKIPAINFIFNDSADNASIDHVSLMKVLSDGERKALHILNIIFEIESRKKNSVPTLFIVDDIADSFDYKNKYAIIQYLKDLSEENIFNQIILTHNFDFFRTIKSRFVGNYSNCLMVDKSLTETKIVKANYIDDPLVNFIDHLDDDKKLVASIPFVRNIIEYTKGNGDDFKKLTSLLHVKSDSDSILNKDLEGIYKRTFNGKTISLKNPSNKVTDLIFNSVKRCMTPSGGVNLENKIVLAISIRLKAEKFMFDRLTDKREPAVHQTWELFDRFKREFGKLSVHQNNIKILDQVNLMTPGNIHLNSFMYEPILDMSEDCLISLYNAVLLMT